MITYLSDDQKRVRHWETTVQLLWNIPDVVNGLERALELETGMKILDASCGTGDLAIELVKRGYHVQCSDADLSMLSRSEEKRKQIEEKLRKNITIDKKALEWKNLPQRKRQKYDIVIIRGNSLPYVCSWSNEEQHGAFDAEAADRALIESFQGVRRILNTNGLFYFDMRSLYEKEGKEIVGEKEIDGVLTKLHFDVQYKKGKIRQVLSEIKRGEEREVRIYNGYLIPFARLDDMLLEAGFGRNNIQHCIPVHGENVYTSFIVRK